MSPATIVRTQLISLDGQTFNNREALEDAIFPLFGSLQSMFGGEGHRDLADRMINAGWATKAPGTDNYTVKFPVPAPPASAAPKQAVDQKATLNYEELQLLLEVGNTIPGKHQFFGENETLLDRLIELGFVVVIDGISERQRAAAVEAETRFVGMAYDAIKTQDYYTAISNLENAVKQYEIRSRNDMTYRLTVKGEEVRTNIKKATVTV